MHIGYSEKPMEVINYGKMFGVIFPFVLQSPSSLTVSILYSVCGLCEGCDLN